MSKQLEGKVAIVTGASRGIGEAIARAFSAEGARIVLASRKLDGLTPVAESINAAGGQATAIACHTGSTEEVQNLIAKSVEAYGQIDVLVNNAATNPYFGPMLQVPWAAWDKTFDVNVKGYFAATKAVAEHLIERSAEGAIINVSSVLGLRGGRFQGVYAMTKAAVISMTKTLAVELGPQGIRVNAIAPGFIETKFSSALTSNEEIRQMIVNRTPLGRIGAPEEITGLATYLASDTSKFVTGATFVADGGLTVE